MRKILMLVKTLELTDKEKAIQLMSDENLDIKELGQVLQASIFANSNDPLKLCNELTMVGLRNILNRTIKAKQHE